MYIKRFLWGQTFFSIILNKIKSYGHSSGTPELLSLPLPRESGKDCLCFSLWQRTQIQSNIFTEGPGIFLPFSPMSCRAACTIHSDPRTRICFPFYLGRVLQCQGRAWKVLWDLCSRSVEKAQEAAVVWWDTNLAAAWACPLLQKPLEAKSCPNFTISTCFLIEKKSDSVWIIHSY